MVDTSIINMKMLQGRFIHPNTQLKTESILIGYMWNQSPADGINFTAFLILIDNMSGGRSTLVTWIPSSDYCLEKGHKFVVYITSTQLYQTPFRTSSQMYPHALNINNFLSTFKVVFPAQNLHQQHQRRYKRSAASRIIYYTGLPNRPCCYQNYRVVTEEKSEHTKEYIAHNKPINDPNGEKKPRTHSPIQQLHIHRRNFWGTEATSDWLHPRCSEPAIWYVECELLSQTWCQLFLCSFMM